MQRPRQTRKPHRYAARDAHRPRYVKNSDILSHPRRPQRRRTPAAGVERPGGGGEHPGAAPSKIRVDADRVHPHIGDPPSRQTTTMLRPNDDYARIASAIEFIASEARRQPHLDEIARHAGMSPYHFQRLFSRWAGVTPKRFLQVLTVERAKALLAASRPLLDVSDAVGLSSGSRLHDHFVSLEAVTPGEFRGNGTGLAIRYGIHSTPFGDAFIATTPRGICRLAFVDDGGAESPLAELARAWPHADVAESAAATADVVAAIFGRGGEQRFPLHVAGTNFQVNVWKALLQIVPGELATYADVARAAGSPRAVRAAGRAVGANPVAFLIPCHRVIRQTGELGGYRWGTTLKHALHAWETAAL